jgi:hypothetical protein
MGSFYGLVGLRVSFVGVWVLRVRVVNLVGYMVLGLWA